MEVVVVEFLLDGMTDEQYEQLCEQVAPAFAEVPGLVSKVWLCDPATAARGGVYTFVEAAAVDAFLASDLFRGVGATPGLADVTVRRFGVLAGPTAVTRGLVAAAV